MLTISQLAACVGCTVKAVRVYHRRGLLPEPARDASGYRRYDAQAVIDLTRITTLARCGVPLADIPALLDADDAEYAAAADRIDRSLALQLTEIRRRRARLRLIRSPERLCLPEPVVARLIRLRALGLSDRALAAERDSWILAQAVLPAFTEHYLPARLALLDDPAYVEVIRGFDQIAELDPEDPRLDTLVDATVALSLRRFSPQEQQHWESLPRRVLEVVASFRGHDSRAWSRVLERVDQKLAADRTPQDLPHLGGEGGASHHV